MTVDAEELKQIMEAAERDEKSTETDELLHVGKIVLPKELPTFDEEFYQWKRDYWANRIKEEGIKYIVAPMVDQSELAFRMLMRRHNAHLFYTPMIHAHLFVNNLTYRKTALSSVPEDRPLIVQFCANEPDTFLDACRLVEDFCDGVDLNLGCPQMIAKRGRYGAFLQEEPELIVEMISKVHKHCRLPLSVKIRVLEDLQATINYARIIEKAGASMLTVHGRLRSQKGVDTGIADWDKIREVKDALKIPVVANGNIQMPGDAERCISETGTVGVMSAEGLLSNPLLFEGQIRPGYEVAEEYLDLAVKYKAHLHAVRAHVYRFCHYSLADQTHMRYKFSLCASIDEFRAVVQEIREIFEPQAKEHRDGLKFLDGTEESLTEQVHKMPAYFAKPYVRPPKRVGDEPVSELRAKRRQELEKIQAETGLSFRRIRKRERRKLNKTRSSNYRKEEYPICDKCGQPGGATCQNTACRKCCRGVCIRENKVCKGHQFTEAFTAPKHQQYLKAQEERSKFEQEAAERGVTEQVTSNQIDEDAMDKIEEPLDEKVAG